MSQHSLEHATAISALAEVLYEFLPGSGNRLWKGHVNFQTVATRVGVGDFCQPGSKLPMITTLLELSIQNRPRLFPRLLIEIVRAGIVYRRKQSRPITVDEIDAVCGLSAQLGFPISELSNERFRDTIAADPIETAKRRAQDRAAIQATEERGADERRRALSDLEGKFYELHAALDRQRAGYALEAILNKLFALANLQPREPFRVIGEQIDGSFQLDHEAYLLEAKWESKQVNEQSLLVFRGKVEGKSKFTRGVFISINGFTVEAQDAITRGKQPNFFAIDGYDLVTILAGKVHLTDFLRQRQRQLADTGCVFRANST